MNKLFIIIKREYLSKVAKKSFFVLTILGPILLTLLIVLPVILSENTASRYNVIVVDNTEKTVIGGDTVSFYKGKYKSDQTVNYSYSDDIASAQKLLKEDATDGVLEIVSTNDKPHIKTFLYYGENEPSVDVQSRIENDTKEIFKNSILAVNYGMSKEDIESVNDPEVGFYTKDINTGDDSNAEVKMIIGFILGFAVYFFIFYFGGQIMRSVSEEKTSKIVEVLVSSVKSIHLLFGKIIAVALVGLTQLVLWIVLTLILLGGVRVASPEMFTATDKQQTTINQRVVTDKDTAEINLNDEKSENILQMASQVNFPLIVGMFLLYFLLGYLLYGALFGAVGSLIDDDSDAGQFSLPITVPLIFAIICLPMVTADTSSSLSVWLSIIPFTSPLIMLVRIPFGVETWELVTSIALLVVTIIASMYISAKIYRTGILTYGRQIHYKDLLKWIKRKGD